MMSESEAAEPIELRNGAESPFVVSAVDAILDGDAVSAQRALMDGAAAASWAAIAHRLDVAGRALADECDIERAADVDWLDATSLFAGDVDEPVATEARQVFDAWRAGDGLAVAVDLRDGGIDARDDLEQVWPAVLVLSWLVDRVGFPAQVVV